MHQRLLRRFDVLDAATSPEDINLPGFDFHGMKGHNPTRTTFELRGGDAYVLNFEQYH